MLSTTKKATAIKSHEIISNEETTKTERQKTKLKLEEKRAVLVQKACGTAADPEIESIETEEISDQLSEIASMITSVGETIEALVEIASRTTVGEALEIAVRKVDRSHDPTAGEISSLTDLLLAFYILNYSRRRTHRRGSSSAKKSQQRDVKKIPSPRPAKSPEKKPLQESAPLKKKTDDPDDIAELERRVLEAKKVLEVMVKEKMKEVRQSTSPDERKRSKKSSRRRSSSD